MSVEDAFASQLHAQVESRLAAQAGEDAVRPFSLEDALDTLNGQRLEIDDVRDAGVGHDRRRVAVEQDRAHTLVAQRTARLGSGVIELGGLADDHRATADDQHGRRLHELTLAMNRSKTASASSGPGDPSGWYWTVSIGLVVWRRPSTEPSFRLRWL